MSKDQIIFIMFLSAAMQLLGTWTVAVNYSRGASLAKEIMDQLDDEVENAATRSKSPAYELRQDSALQANADLNAYRTQSRKTIRALASHLRSRPYLTAGIVAYTLGACFGLIAGIGALRS